MALPKQVQAQLAEVEELEKQLKAQDAEAPPEPVVEDTEVEVTEEPAKQEAKLRKRSRLTTLQRKNLRMTLSRSTAL